MNYKKLFFGIIASIVLLFSFIPLAPAQADDYGLSATAESSGLKKAGQEGPTVPVLAGTIIGTALSMISVIFFILMIYGGFLWMTAHGDDGQVKKAQETIIAAVIGIIVILAAYAITNFVTTSVVSSTSNSGGNIGGGAGGDPVAACNAQEGMIWDGGACINMLDGL